MSSPETPSPRRDQAPPRPRAEAPAARPADRAREDAVSPDRPHPSADGRLAVPPSAERPSESLRRFLSAEELALLERYWLADLEEEATGALALILEDARASGEKIPLERLWEISLERYAERYPEAQQRIADADTPAARRDLLRNLRVHVVPIGLFEIHGSLETAEGRRCLALYRKLSQWFDDNSDQSWREEPAARPRTEPQPPPGPGPAAETGDDGPRVVNVLF